MVRVGRNVRRLRLARDMSQEDLAHAAGLHVTIVSRLERAEREPRLGTLVALSRALTVPLADVIDGVK